MFQKFFYGIGHVLLNVVNSSLVRGEVPSSWKHAVITPLPKCANATAPADHRPLSILPAITKVIERIVQQQLVTYFKVNHLFTSNQHGYRTSHSTETALALVTERIYRAMDRGQICIVMFLDLTKCFDVVDHANLLRKLTLYGVDIEWFSNYLAGHTQKVKVCGNDGVPVMSNSLPNDIGVYQGGSLSCLLYSIYANDMGLHLDDMENIEIVKFADDTQILISGHKTNLARMIETLELALSRLSDWFNENRLKINAKKTQMMVFGSKPMLKNVPNIRVNFCGTFIEESRVVKNLGLHMDRHMTFSSHIDHVVGKCSGRLIALMHAKHSLPKSSIKPIVNALIISSVRYCISIYGTSTKTEENRIQKIINFAARVISGRKKYERISDVIKELNWLSASQLVQYHRTCLVHKVISTGLPETLNACISANAHHHEHETRQSDQLRLPSIKTDFGRRQLAYSGVQLHNKVSQKMRGEGRTFKAALMKTIRSEPG